MNNNHLPASAKFVEDYNTACTLLENTSRNFLDDVGCRSWSTSAEFKLRVIPDAKTFDNLVPVEIRGTDLLDKDAGKIRKISRTDWMPLNNTLSIMRSHTVWRTYSERVKKKEDPLTIKSLVTSGQEVEWQLFVHASSLDERREEVKKYYSPDGNRKNVNYGDNSKDSLESCGDNETVLTLQEEPVYLVFMDGTVITIDWYYPNSDSNEPLLVFGSDKFLAFEDEGWDRGFTQEVEDDDMYDKIDRFRPNYPYMLESLTDLMQEYNYELDDPYLLGDGEELEDVETHFIYGSYEGLEEGAKMLFWAFIPEAAWLVNGEPANLEFPVYTSDDNDGACVDWDGMYDDWNSHVSHSDTMLEIFECTILEDNYPVGHTWEYNDGDGNRYSGYSENRNYMNLEIEPPESKKDVALAKRWVKEKLGGRARDVQLATLEEMEYTPPKKKEKVNG